MWKYWTGCEIRCPALMPTVQDRYWVVREFRKKKMEESRMSWKTWFMRKASGCSRDLRTKSLCSQSKTQCQTQTGFRGFFSLANRPKNWKRNQEHPFRHMVHTFYRKDDLPLEHLSSSLKNVTSLDTKHFTGFFSKRCVLFQPKLIWEKCGLCNLHVWGLD